MNKLSLNLTQLKKICKENKISNYSSLNKTELELLIITFYELDKLSFNELIELRKKYNLKKLHFIPKNELIKKMVTELLWNFDTLNFEILKNINNLKSNLEFNLKSNLESNLKSNLEFKNFEFEIMNFDAIQLLPNSLPLLPNSIPLLPNSLPNFLPNDISSLPNSLPNDILFLPNAIPLLYNNPIEVTTCWSFPDTNQINTNQINTIKLKRQQIPKHVKTIVWNTYIGEDIIKHKCLCCKKVTIKITEFDAGHIISDKDGGTHEINNLRPICSACNHSMGAMNMIDYIKKYGLYI